MFIFILIYSIEVVQCLQNLQVISCFSQGKRCYPSDTYCLHNNECDGTLHFVSFIGDTKLFEKWFFGLPLP